MAMMTSPMVSLSIMVFPFIIVILSIVVVPSIILSPIIPTKCPYRAARNQPQQGGRKAYKG